MNWGQKDILLNSMYSVFIVIKYLLIFKYLIIIYYKIAINYLRTFYIFKIKYCEKKIKINIYNYHYKLDVIYNLYYNNNLLLLLLYYK